MSTDKSIKMGESAYIVVGDLKAVEIASNVLRAMVQANNPFIDKDEYRGVIVLLDKWFDAMLNEIELIG